MVEVKVTDNLALDSLWREGGVRRITSGGSDPAEEIKVLRERDGQQKEGLKNQ